MKRTIPVLLLCLLAQGCVGIATSRTKAETFRNPKIWDWPSVYSARESEASGVTNTASYSASWLRTHWGKPASVRSVSSQGRDEMWTYKFGLLWNGAVPMLGIPIPLIVPVGRERVEFVLRDAQVISATRTHEQGYEAVAGWYWYGPCGPTWGSIRRSIP